MARISWVKLKENPCIDSLLRLKIGDFFDYLLQYIWPKGFEMWMMSDFYRKHITVKYGQGKMKMVVIQHYDLVRAIYRRIYKYKAKHNYKEFISYSLRQAMKGCNHIIFLIDEEDGRFVQYWTRRKILYLDFPMFGANSLAVHRSEVINLLKNLGFKKVKDCLEYKSIVQNPRFYSLRDCPEGEVINANFLTNVELATDFTIELLNNIQKVEPELVDILMG